MDRREVVGLRAELGGRTGGWIGGSDWGVGLRGSRVVYCVVIDPASSQRHDKIGMMTARHSDRPYQYRDRGGK